MHSKSSQNLKRYLDCYYIKRQKNNHAKTTSFRISVVTPCFHVFGVFVQQTLLETNVVEDGARMDERLTITS